jgi:hypothetical protein
MFSNPAYLFALTGLTIPVVIHFLSRKEGKIIKLGSVRHVVETSTQQFKGFKLNEIILLVLRCALITVFSLLLSGLRCSTQSKEKWTIVEKGLERIPHLHSVLDSLKNDGYSLHLLARGFPDLSDSNRHSVEINYWQLVEDLKINNLSEAIVFSKNNIRYFNGMRSALPINIRWISQPLPPANFAVRAVRCSADSASLRTGHTASDKTYFITEKINVKESPIAITPQDTIKIALVSDDEFDYDRKIIRAALLTLEKFFPIKMIVKESDPSKVSSSSTDWCVWISSQKTERINAKKIIQIDPQASCDLIVQTEPNHWVITKRLNQEVALLNNLTTHLATLMLSEKNLQEKISINDRRMLSDSLAWSRPEGGKDIQAANQYQPACRNLIILLFALLIIERIIAYQKNQ